MLTAASVMINASEYSGASITKQWLMRRAVRSPVSRFTTCAHQLVRVQRSLHERLGATLANEFNGSCGRRLAMGNVDNFEALTSRRQTSPRPP